MREKKYFVYSFDELSIEQQEKAIERYRDINIDYNGWHDPVLKDSEEKLERQGFMDPIIYYTGFYSQGDGASFTAWLDLEKFLKGRRCASKYAKEIKAYRDGALDIKIKQSGLYSHEYTMSIECYDDAMTDELERFIIEEARDQARAIYKALRDYYEELQEDQAVIDTLIANNYQFTSDGKID